MVKIAIFRRNYNFVGIFLRGKSEFFLENLKQISDELENFCDRKSPDPRPPRFQTRLMSLFVSNESNVVIKSEIVRQYSLVH